DLIGAMRTVLDRSRTQIRKEIQQAKEAGQTMQECLERIEQDEGGLLRAALRGQLSQLEHVHAKAEALLATHERAIEYLKGCKFRCEKTHYGQSTFLSAFKEWHITGLTL